ncbi:SCO family protein [Actinacidiphila sp. DG2A-62]|uniref:SCO family protein n=1 Tax=Actinacidiphila sp. DG2A-62 TaxID=3108821 RepID=UPI002DBF9845|nr:SCO family protein [Actinacidiphila sp. DG2A-62]MEC3993879.1 SCO family protein [Actinacidiphila sp. DG2A-62]
MTATARTPAGPSTGPPTAPPTGPPTGPPIDGSMRPARRFHAPASQTFSAPAGRVAERRIDQTADQTADQNAGRVADRTTDRTADQTAGRTTDRTAGRGAGVAETAADVPAPASPSRPDRGSRALRGPRRRRLLASACLVAVGAAVIAGCSGSSSGGASGSAGSGDAPAAVVTAGGDDSGPPGAITFDTPFPKPALRLTDQDGKPYDLRRATAGRALLLYFGYTHCPDVCPTTMADLAGALRRLPAGTARPAVVFVSTDPGRDTPARLKEWLGAIDPRFVGLTGDFETIRSAATGLGISVAPPVRNADGSETVSHGAEVVAFSPKDGLAHLLFPSGTSESTYAADLPGVVAGAAS